MLLSSRCTKGSQQLRREQRRGSSEEVISLFALGEFLRTQSTAILLTTWSAFVAVHPSRTNQLGVRISLELLFGCDAG